jgi:hypothetical protein
METTTAPIHCTGIEKTARAVIGIFVILVLFSATGCAIAGAADTAVPELVITGPLVPGEIVPAVGAEGLVLNVGSKIHYTADGIMQVSNPDGTEQFTARESDAKSIHFVSKETRETLDVPATRVIKIHGPTMFLQGKEHSMNILSGADYTGILALHDDRPVATTITYMFGDDDNEYTHLTETSDVMTVGYTFTIANV